MRDPPSLYVGETSRSLAERAGEHWDSAKGGNCENHMLDHEARAHKNGGEGGPQFRFLVVKKCKTALERQVREAIRIHLRGNVLNKKGHYNRCKLTRLVVDTDWEEKVRAEAWSEQGPPEQGEVEEQMREGTKHKRAIKGGQRKRRKYDSGEEDKGWVWGAPLSEEEKAKQKFMRDRNNPLPVPKKMKQTTLVPVKFERLNTQVKYPESQKVTGVSVGGVKYTHSTKPAPKVRNVLKRKKSEPTFKGKLKTGFKNRTDKEMENFQQYLKPKPEPKILTIREMLRIKSNTQTSHPVRDKGVASESPTM